MMNLKKGIIVIAILCFNNLYSQSFNDNKVSIGNFLIRMYNANPFEGVKVLESVEGNYLISVISLEKSKYPNQSTIMRVAQVKAQSQANIFINGSTISESYIIKTKEQTDTTHTKLIIETIDYIRENSVGFVNGLELLLNFDVEDGKRTVFIYYKILEPK
jgi:hypothetical protein